MLDFRTPELSREFRERFDEALRAAMAGSGISFRVSFATATLPRPNFEPEIRELERVKPDVYYATTTDIAREVRGHNPAVPVIFSGIVDPREAGLVTSLERPGNNMTGFVIHSEVEDKRLEILASMNARIKRIGIVFAGGTRAEDTFPLRREYGRRVGLEIVPVRWAEGIDAAALRSIIAQQRLDALDVPASAFLRSHYGEIIEAARGARIPTSFRSVDFVERGAVMSYEPREFDYATKAAGLVARILRGARPAEIPVEFPSEFDLSINLEAAARLPYRIDNGLLYRANRIIDGHPTP